MPGFKDALKSYKNRDGAAAPTEAAPVPVNPPEAVKVLEKQTEPETEGKPEPASLEVAKPKATRAPRGSKPKSAEPTASTDSAEPQSGAPSASSAAVEVDGRDVSSSELDYLIALVQRRLPLGVSITITRG